MPPDQNRGRTMKNFKIPFIAIAIAMACSPLYAANGRKIVASAGTAEALTSTYTPFSKVSICAETDNTGVIAVGDSGVIASLATRTGVPLSASDCYTINAGDSGSSDLRAVYIDTTVSGDGVTYHSI